MDDNRMLGLCIHRCTLGATIIKLMDRQIEGVCCITSSYVFIHEPQMIITEALRYHSLGILNSDQLYDVGMYLSEAYAQGKCQVS